MLPAVHSDFRRHESSGARIGELPTAAALAGRPGRSLTVTVPNEGRRDSVS